MVRNFSFEVERLKVEGLSGTEIMRKDSRGDTAVDMALRMPYLSH